MLCEAMDTMSAHARKQTEETSPSRWHGIDAAKEQQLRKFYARFVQELGKALRLPQQPTIASASILCHRFFLRQSHAENDCLLVASACLLLASKSEDTPCGLAYIAGTSYNLQFGTETAPDNPFVLRNKKLQKDAEQRILLAEHLVLCTLGFELEVELPYKPLFAVLRMLRENLMMQKELIKLGERRLKSETKGKGQMAKPDQKLEEYEPMDVKNSASKFRDRDVGAGYVVAQNLSNPVVTDTFGLHHAGVQHGSTLSQFRDSQYLREGETAFHQVAWNFVNDTLLTLMCMQFKPHQLAAGAVWLAAKFLGVKLPSEAAMSWWREMNVTPLELEEVGSKFLDVYTVEESNRCQVMNPKSVSKPHNLSR